MDSERRFAGGGGRGEVRCGVCWCKCKCAWVCFEAVVQQSETQHAARSTQHTQHTAAVQVKYLGRYLTASTKRTGPAREQESARKPGAIIQQMQHDGTGGGQDQGSGPGTCSVPFCSVVSGSGLEGGRATEWPRGVQVSEAPEELTGVLESLERACGLGRGGRLERGA
ncbi:hypothetical protein BU24DRAFT_168231 [Aaosphaeria arxii CBS 175.79]|uniref:Uncharacterized protein n=1 Tax=Aaosphaeria arxii CBS 175.79 TaxID=1450172 RepID=A0A6A5XZ84_9PLEO|nr:uncharacterized protein BU24DRAFT_168231 [Aaosphaeria arxii CBS 175.79]KAF2018306.1 hypothetical protein BU24DRAFT_168231 [Aaosphaeria arxii CBS 175.79]